MVQFNSGEWSPTMEAIFSRIQKIGEEKGLEKGLEQGLEQTKIEELREKL